MSRRKRTPLKPRNVIGSIVVCTALCFAGIGYIWAKTQVWALSRDKKVLELRLEELWKKNDVLKQTYAAMCTQARLDESVKRLKLGLAAPQPEQMIRLTEPTPIVRSSQPFQLPRSAQPPEAQKAYAAAQRSE